MPASSVERFEGEAREWDAAVRRLPGGSFCHLHAWAGIFQEAFGHTTDRWVVRDGDGAITALLPVVRMKSLLFGKNHLSQPFLNYGGPLGRPEDQAALVRHAVDEGRRTGAKLVELRSRAPVETDVPVSNAKVTVVLPLPDDPEVLWKEGLKAKVRSQVRRPMKAGMTSSFDPGALDEFYEVFARNMRDLGTPVLPRRFFESILKRLPGESLLCLVRAEDGTPVAGGLGFLFEDEFELTWASSLREYNRDAPNMLLYWSLMEEVIRRGGGAFNFGRCTPGGGTHRFKLQWGGSDETLHWIRWTASQGDTPPSKEGGLYRRAIQAWQRLPLPVANALGPVISRGLPTW